MWALLPFPSKVGGAEAECERLQSAPADTDLDSLTSVKEEAEEQDKHICNYTRRERHDGLFEEKEIQRLGLVVRQKRKKKLTYWVINDQFSDL